MLLEFLPHAQNGYKLIHNSLIEIGQYQVPRFLPHSLGEYTVAISIPLARGIRWLPLLLLMINCCSFTA